MQTYLSKLFSSKVILTGIAAGIVLILLAAVLAILTAPLPPELNNTVALATIIPNPTSQYSAPVIENDPYKPTPTPTAAPGQISIGTVVQVTGTEGIGLRFRASPNLVGQEVFMGFDTEAFNVLDGPRQADGYTWYFLSSVNNENRNGWAVSNYLTVLPQ